ncbi:MAG TPA: acyl-CoA dehydrogenase family protein [Sphingopyxis sp.]|nr:acyl-CoA dehydrogenase family protein [Sphingopyxis sp.]
MINFALEPEFAAKLDWVREFVDTKITLLDALWPSPASPHDRKLVAARRIADELQAEVKARGLWAAHLDQELGGPGFGQVKYLHIAEILGRTNWGSMIFGCQAPDSGNSEIIARYGTDEQKKRYLEPLLDGSAFSAFSMTEPEGGSDPVYFTCRAVQDGDDYVIDGEKWFSSHANYADFLIIMAVTDPEAEPYRRASMFIVPTDTHGVEFVRETGVFTEGHDERGGHPYMRYTNLRVPASAMLGPRGGGFEVAQSRLGGGRIHHAMRTIGLCQKAIDMMATRAVSRKSSGVLIAEKQSVQFDLAEAEIALQQLRLLVLHCAWLADQPGMERELRAAISRVKVASADVAEKIIWKAMHVHGSLGVSNEMPFAHMLFMTGMLGLADGPTEVHKVSVARRILRGAKSHEGFFPPDHLPALRAKGLAEFGLTSEDLSRRVSA